MLVIARNACKDPLTSNFCLTMTQGSSMRFARAFTTTFVGELCGRRRVKA